MTAPPSSAPPPRDRRGGGCLVAAGLIGGAAIGVFLHEGSIGVVAGFAIGAAGALLFWLIDRRR